MTNSFKDFPVRWTVTAGALLGATLFFTGINDTFMGSIVGGGLFGLLAGAIIDQ
jgi:hypothetical protein